MTTTPASFFAAEGTTAIFRRFLRDLDAEKVSEPPALNVVPSLKQLFNIFTKNPTAFDQHCASNIEWIGQSFVAEVREYSSEKEEHRTEALLSIFTSAYRFLCEIEFTQSADLSIELRRVKVFVDENLDSFPPAHRRQLVFANYLMPANITKRLIDSPALVEFKEFSNTAKAAAELKKDWDEELVERNKQINALREGLERIQTTYNFVGLVNGFETLAKEKRTEKQRAVYFTLALGLLMIVPIASQLWFILNHADTIDSHRNSLLYSLPTTLALEIVILYFFRITLSNYKNATNQLLQINLRVTLCQFIQSYSEYSSKIKKDDSTALEKFENLIFSAITPEAGSIPSTFDGIDHFAKLISSIRSK